MPGKKKTLGFLYSSWEGVFSEKNMLFLKQYTNEHDMNLILINVTSYETIEQEITQKTITHALFNSDNIDGLIINPGTAISIVGEELYERFQAAWDNIPLVQLSIKMDDSPAILIDNQAGVIEVVEHLVIKHNIRDIAFIRGPENNVEAEERYKAYLSGLDKMGIPFKPELVLSGDFQWKTGVRIAREMLEKKKLPGAVISANDLMAMDFAGYLMDNGVKVPEDIAIIGFDDLEDSEIFKVPLTTVKQPFDMILNKAVDMIDELIQGKRPEDSVYPTKFVVRSSCGCLPGSIELMARQSKKNEMDPSPEAFMGFGIEKPAAVWLAALASGILKSLKGNGNEDQLLGEVHSIITSRENSPITSEPWQKAVSLVRGAVLGQILNAEELARLTGLMEKMRVLISQQVELDKRQLD